MSKPKNDKSESLLKDFINALPEKFVFDLSKMDQIIALEKKYDEIGRIRLEKLLELSKVEVSEGERNFFILGFSECGQDMHKDIERLKEIVSIQKQMLEISSHCMPEPDDSYIKLANELEKIK
jgi:hypothetical protein